MRLGLVWARKRRAVARRAFDFGDPVALAEIARLLHQTWSESEKHCKEVCTWTGGCRER